VKKLFGSAWLPTWVAAILPERMAPQAKRTPWYRLSWPQFAPWVGAALMAPFALFLGWKGLRALTSINRPAAS